MNGLQIGGQLNRLTLLISQLGAANKKGAAPKSQGAAAAKEKKRKADLVSDSRNSAEGQNAGTAPTRQQEQQNGTDAQIGKQSTKKVKKAHRGAAQ